MFFPLGHKFIIFEIREKIFFSGRFTIQVIEITWHYLNLRIILFYDYFFASLNNGYINNVNKNNSLIFDFVTQNVRRTYSKVKIKTFIIIFLSTL